GAVHQPHREVRVVVGQASTLAAVFQREADFVSELREGVDVASTTAAGCDVRGVVAGSGMRGRGFGGVAASGTSDWYVLVGVRGGCRWPRVV
ncbi:MAG: hypothetical protein ACRDRO_21920, partial [Pseudonocardiaceae bacterium]